MSQSMTRYAHEISQFIQQAATFQKAFLLGSYSEANNLLEKILTEFGWSLWLLEKRFLLSEYAYGLEANKKILTEIVEDEENDIVLQIIADYISLRCEAKLSVENYRQRLNRHFDITEEDFPRLSAYFRYRLEGVGVDLIKIATLVTYFEGPSPIIDRYLTFVAILQACTTADDDLSKIAKNVISKISGIILDPRVESLLQFFTPERPLKWDPLSLELINAREHYNVGAYDKSAEASRELIIKNPEIFELYYIYIRSLDHKGKAFKQLFPKNSIAATILEHSNVLLRGEASYRSSSIALSKLYMSLWRDPLAYELYNFNLNETVPSPEKRFHDLALLNSSHLNPNFATIFRDPEKAAKYLDQLCLKVGENNTVSLIKALTIESHHVGNFNFPLSIPETRRRIYGAKIHVTAGRPQSAISILKPLFTNMMEKKFHGSFYTQDRVISTLFRCYIDTKQLAECTDMVVHSFLRNELSTRKLPLKLLVESIDDTSPPDVMRKITYPILYSIVSTKPRTIYVAYDNFLNSIGVRRPSHLIDISDQFSQKELEEFLSRVCKIDVLACSFHFRGTKDLESERILICQFLSKNNPENLKTYSDEISTITSRSLIREGIRQIDVSKIYVDESGVRSTGRVLLEESFRRYQELASMSSIETLKMLDKESIQLYHLSENGKLIKKPISKIELQINAATKRVVHNSCFLLFRELFLDVRDRFISSGEHGLDGYLSVRIRHGVLQNQIRSPFEMLHLISEKDKTTGEYLSNPFWDKKLENVSNDTRLSIQKLLADFSRKVDEIAQKLNKEMIQVKTELKHSAGLFDYVFSLANLFDLFEEEFIHLSDFDQFLDAVFRILWKRTNENLELIRKTISVTLKNIIHDSIRLLEVEIRNLIEPNQANELLQNIARCQTNLQYNLDGVAQWFTISRSSIIPQFSLDDLVKICIASINNIYPNKKVYPDTKFNGDVIIDGAFFAPFFDIVRTLLDNVLVHSDLPPEEMSIKIETIISEGRLILKIKNNLAKTIRELDPVASLKSTHSSIQASQLTGIIAKEGRSGLMKVHKIMAIDLQRKDFILDFSYDEDDRFAVMVAMEMEGLRK
jgi:hypothetical protein